MYDILIIGGGPGGYVAGSYASQFGKQVAVIEKDLVGGCCLNAGCIPTKTILEAATRYTYAISSDAYGISGTVAFEWATLKGYSEKVRADLRNGVNQLLKSRNCDLITGEASFVDNHTVIVGDKEYSAENIIIASGSKPAIPQKYSAVKRVLTSDTFWDLKVQPKSIVIVGGGVIGCEIASALSRLGSKVTIIEQMANVLPEFDKEAVKLLREELLSCGVDILCGQTVTDIEERADSLEVFIGDKTLNCAYLLWATGRKPIVPKNANISLDDRGFIKVDINYRTSSSNVYAIGDVNGKGMLAHAAISQAMLVVKHICTGAEVVEKPLIPQTVFTSPAIARIGRIDDSVAIGVASFNAVGYSHVISYQKGYCKIARDIESDTLIGAEIVGHNACELIHIIAPLINKKVELRMLMDTMVAHPTLSEGIKLAIEASYIMSPQI